MDFGMVDTSLNVNYVDERIVECMSQMNVMHLDKTNLLKLDISRLENISVKK